MDNRTKYGAWSGVNYAIPEIRALAVSYVEEVCQNYDVDGIEIDFCRHLSYFPTVARGGTATPDEIGAMNELMAEMRRVTDREGMRRGRPILLTVRVPDDAEYGRAIGLDFEFWMKEHLADIFIGSDYFHLNQWKTWVDLGHQYQVPIYACLSESRVRSDDKRFFRDDEASYAARSIAAWDAGVDGIHIFNVYKPKSPFLKSCGSPDTLASVDKVFFQTTQYGGYRPSSYLKEGEDYRRLPLLCPDEPFLFAAGEEKELEMDFGREAKRNPKEIRICCLFESGADSVPLEITVNGQKLAGAQPNADWPHWVDWRVDPGQLTTGINRVTLTAGDNGAVLQDIAVQFTY